MLPDTLSVVCKCGERDEEGVSRVSCDVCVLTTVTSAPAHLNRGAGRKKRQLEGFMGGIGRPWCTCKQKNMRR